MREPEPRAHARRVGLDRRVDERAEVGELDDPGRPSAPSRRPSMPRNAPARRMFSRPVSSWSNPAPERQQARDPAVDLDRPRGRRDDPGEDLEQRALAGAVRADDGERLAVDELEADVAERPEVVGRLARLSRFTNERWRVVLRVNRRLYLTPSAAATSIADRRVRARIDRRRGCAELVSGRPSQDLGERRLDPLEERASSSASRTSEPTSTLGQARASRAPAVVDDVPVGGEEVAHGLSEQDAADDRQVLRWPSRSWLDRVERGREVEPQAQDVARRCCRCRGRRR